MERIVEATRRLMVQGLGAAWAVIIHSEGSAPRREGSRAVIRGGEVVEGSVGGGVLEARVVREAQRLKPGQMRVVEFELGGLEAAKEGMICGGRAQVALEMLGPEDLELVEAVGRVLEEGGGCLVTLVEEARAPWSQRHLVVGPRGVVAGNRGLWGEDAGALVGLGRPRLVHAPAGRLFLEPLVPTARLIIFGAGHISRELAPLAARVGFRVWVVDDRAEFADPRRLAGAEVVKVVELSRAVEEVGVGRGDYVVIVTRGHLHDMRILRKVLAGQEPAYVGMIGSRRKCRMIFEELASSGIAAERLARVHAPIGLDIGAHEPAEIALSIAAELVLVRSARARGLEVPEAVRLMRAG